MVIRFVFDDFRSHEINRPTASFRRILNDFGETEIPYLAGVGSIFIFLKKNVLTFEIPVNYVAFVDGLDPLHDLVENTEGLTEAENSV